MAVIPSSLGFVLVSTPGTAVQIVSSVMIVKKLRFEPRRNATTVNVGNVYIGGKLLNKNVTSTIFAVLSPEQTDGVEITSYEADISSWYVDADTGGDGVLVGYLW